MPESVETSTLAEASAALADLSRTLTSAEDDLLSCLVVMGEPEAQGSVDGWVDQVVDVLRAVDEVTAAHLVTLSRVTSRQSPGPGQPGSADASAEMPSDAAVDHSSWRQ